MLVVLDSIFVNNNNGKVELIDLHSLVFLKPWGFEIRGIYDKERSHKFQNLTVLEKSP
jgi:hypothetical protein